MRYNNYHKHDHYGNPWISDVAVKPEDYIRRAQELGHTTVFTTNHGVTGSIFDWLTQTKDTDLKMIYGTEAYFVRSFEEDENGKRDRSNKHLIIIARNNDGVMQLNDIMSTAHDAGFYYRPRIDLNLLFSLEPKNFILTSACVAGIWDDPELLLALHRRFGENFFLEVQPHNIELQKEVNARMLALGKEVGIQIIHANDSHYILPEDAKYRNIYLRGHEMLYNDEDGMILDYPDSDTIFERYEKQGILKERDVYTALCNTYIFDECEKITLINDDIKLPSISSQPNEDLKRIINDRWLQERKTIPKEEWPKYLSAIREEVKVVEDTGMANYFLIDHEVVKTAQEEFGGQLTYTGRGSAPSFYITKMLGLTDIDRVDAPITLFPSRFMSVERILGSRSLPDIDLNTADRTPFIKATKKLLGEENCEWMLSWKPLQDSSAFRLYCKGSGLHISEYDDVAKNLDDYRDDPKWKDLIEGSKRFIGVIDSVSESPCSMCLYDKPLRKEIGLVRMPGKKAEKTLCCMLDGLNCDKYKYLKNDYLTVQVWAIIRDVCKLADIPIPTINELNQLLDEKTYKIYDDGLTCSINQADSEFATPLAMRFKPRSVSDMSAFVAILRPGCASLLQDFIDRKPYTTGVPELDEILIEGSHRMIYQELIMKYLIWLGIPETGSYDIIKKIAKKKFKEQELAELKEKLIAGWVQRVGKEDGFNETWEVVEDAARYSFNASHSLSYAYDSLYGAYLKSHYPLEYYTVAMNYYSGDEARTLKLTGELSAFDIKLKPIQFRYSQAGYSLSREDNSIYKGISSIKYMSEAAATELYNLRDRKYSSFVELLSDIKKETSVDNRQLKILISLNFFDEFGDPNFLMKVAEIFLDFPEKQFSKDRLTEWNVPVDAVTPYCQKETAKMLYQYDKASVVSVIAKHLPWRQRTLKETLDAQKEYLGYCTISGDQYSGLGYVMEVDTKYSPRLKVYGLKKGEVFDCKIDKRTFNKDKLHDQDLIRITGQTAKPKSRLNNGVWEPIPNTSDLWITKYQKVVNL